LLIIDDHEPSADALARLLRLGGHSSTLAGTIAAARELLANERFDLIVSDMSLPDGHAIELMEYFRGKKPCPAIAISGTMDSSDHAKCRQAGFDDCLRKPVLFQELTAAIARVMTAFET